MGKLTRSFDQYWDYYGRSHGTNSDSKGETEKGQTEKKFHGIHHQSKLKVMTKIAFIFLLLYSFYGKAQEMISIHENRVVHIISKEKISYLQVGSHDLVLAEIVKEHPNLVRVKARGEFKGESSLSMVSNGKLYSLKLQYGNKEKGSFHLEQFSFKPADLMMGKSLSQEELKASCRKMMTLKSRKAYPSYRKDGIQVQVKNLALKGDLLFVMLEFKNESQMNLELESGNWWIRDRRELRASNVQEYQIHPQYQHFELKRIPGKSLRKEIYVFPLFRIPENKILQIEFLEKALGNTGRKISLELKAKDCRKPIAL